MSPAELSRGPLSRAALHTVTGRAHEYLEEVEEAVQDNPLLQNQFAEYIDGTAKGAAPDVLDKKMAAAKAEYEAGKKKGFFGKHDGNSEGRGPG